MTRSLLFLGESGALSGKVVAQIELPAKSTSAPMTYLHQGRQYVVTAVTTRDFPAELVALSLPGSSVRPTGAKTSAPAPSPAANAAVPAAPNQPSAGDADPGNGRSVYATACAGCHGPEGRGVDGAGPTLLGQTDLAMLVQKISRGGAEMPPMQTLLTPAQNRDVGSFVAAGLPQR